MKIAIATKNNGKLKEFEELAKGTPYEFIKIPENIKIYRRKQEVPSMKML